MVDHFKELRESPYFEVVGQCGAESRESQTPDLQSGPAPIWQPAHKHALARGELYRCAYTVKTQVIEPPEPSLRLHTAAYFLRPW